MHLAYRTWSRLFQVQRLEHMLPMRQDCSVLALIKAQIERLPRTPGVPGGKGTPQAWVGTQHQWLKVANRGCLAPEQAPVSARRHGTQHPHRPLTMAACV